MAELEPLVQALLREQRRLQLTHDQMSRRLGISLRLWYLVKAGERKPSRFLLQAVTRAFPHFQGRVLDYLTADREERVV